jgi:hypothetical protein
MGGCLVSRALCHKFGVFELWLLAFGGVPV